jgi:UDP:flavonoid glycosyltransferase YjiC (YdhE family)
MCNFCEIKNVSKIEINLLSENEVNDLLYWIKEGIINLDNFYYPLYSKTAEELTKYLYKGYGNNIDDFQVNSEDYNMLFDLRENLYLFSSAKQYQFLREVINLKDFTEAKSIYLKYYDDYLAIELDSTEQVAINVKNWLKIVNNGE